jgi:hypothetical protein
VHHVEANHFLAILDACGAIEADAGVVLVAAEYGHQVQCLSVVAHYDNLVTGAGPQHMQHL